MKKDTNAFQFKKTDNISLRQYVYQEIRDAIIKGHLEPGSRIREVEISNQMGVSRGPVREAIRILEQEGFVISHPYRETVVVDISEEESLNLLVPLRRHFETYAASKASKLLTEDDFAHLDNIVQQMEEASRQNEVERISELDVAFHQFIVERCVSPAMLRIWSSISGQLHARFLIQGYQLPSLASVVEDHRELLSRIREGNLDKIEKYLHAHIY